MIVMVIKVKSGDTYHSCCAVVRNMQRCVYAVPTVSLIHNNEISELEKKIEDSREKSLEKDLEKSQADLRAKLHVLAFHVTVIFFLCICTLPDYISFLGVGVRTEG